MRAALVAVTIAVIVTLVVVGTMLRVVTADDPEDQSPQSVEPSADIARPAPLAAPVSPTGDAAFDAGVTEVARFVETARGHPFRDPVRVELVDDELFTRLLLVDFSSGVDELRTTEVALKALGILPPRADLVSEVERSLSAGVIGFYDPSTAQLVIRGTALTPFTRSTLAHELTHALDDQWFDLDRSELDHADSEQQFGFQALVEGSATWVERRWSESRSATERAAAITESREFASDMDTSGFSLTVIQIIESPYSLGLDFVGHLVAADGVAGIDDAFDTPPISSEQVIHPERYVAGEAVLAMIAPPADGPSIDEGILGELDLTQVLSTSLAPAVARAAGEGWGGDRYVVWRSASGASCLRLDVVGDSPQDSEEIADSLRQWTEAQTGPSRPEASVVALASGVTRFTTCN